VLLVLCTAGARTPADGNALAVEVQPLYCYEPCHVRVVARLQPDTRDRSLLVEADGLMFYSSSTIQLDGETEPGIHRISFKSVPAGHYAVRVSLIRVDGTAATVMRRVRVLEASGEEWSFQ
jgi:hypothetical protein